MEKSKKRNFIFHVRPWEVGIFTGLERYLSTNIDMNLDFLYITHHFRAEYLLKRMRKNCINANAEINRMVIPSDWLERLQELEYRHLGFTRNFQQYLSAERFMQNKARHYQMKQLYRTVVFYDSLFRRIKPFFMLSNGPDHMSFWLAMDLLRSYGGHPCGLVSTSWPKDQIMLFREVGCNYGSRELYASCIKRGLTQGEKDKTRCMQDSLRTGRAMPDFIKPERIKFSRKRTIWERLKSRLSSILWQLVERLKGGWHVEPLAIPGRFLLANSLKKVKAAYYMRYVVDEMDWSKPFVFFPLHLEPEATILIHSNPYDNQLEVIRMLSKAIPVSWKLVVKDHPNMLGQRKSNFIRTVKRLPNVIFIRNDLPSWKLINQARLVTVLTGTAGLEACVLGKPVLGFGTPPWNYAPTYTQVLDPRKLYEELPRAVEKQLAPDHQLVQAFILSWVNSNPRGIYDHFPWQPPVDDPQNVANIGNALARLMADLQNGCTS